MLLRDLHRRARSHRQPHSQVWASTVRAAGTGEGLPLRRSDTLLLRGHVAEVVTLAEHNSVVAQDVVGSGDVEIEVRNRETGQVLAGREAHSFRADLHLDGALCSGEKSVRRV